MLGDRRGVAAVEFALVVPMLAFAYLGGFAICEACATYRKLADATVECANVTAQYTTMQSTDALAVMGATAEIMAPYPTANLSMVLSVVTTDGTVSPLGPVVSVQWSEPYQGGVSLPYGPNTALRSPLLATNTTYILVSSAYNFVPYAGLTYVPSVPMSDYIFVLPRQSPSIPCSTCAT
jgi:Flp pilus assembly protein TadG